MNSHPSFDGLYGFSLYHFLFSLLSFSVMKAQKAISCNRNFRASLCTGSLGEYTETRIMTLRPHFLYTPYAPFGNLYLFYLGNNGELGIGDMA